MWLKQHNVMAENLSYNPYIDMHNDVQLSAMFFGKNIQNIPIFNPTQTIEVKRLYYSLERFTFTGKERDSETGFSYFGARYYDSDILTGWLSVDPMADKYPNISPYAYCAWNPVRLVDPDGRENLSALKWAREKLVNKNIPSNYGDPYFGGSDNRWVYEIGTVPDRTVCYEACFMAYMNSSDNIVEYLKNSGFSNSKNAFKDRNKGIEWFKNGDGTDRKFVEDIRNGELGDIVFMGESGNMQGHAVLLSNLPEFAKDSEGNIDKTTIILKTLSTSSESDPGNFGEKSYIFKQQKDGSWQQVGGAEYIFRGYGQLNKNLENN